MVFGWLGGFWQMRNRGGSSEGFWSNRNRSCLGRFLAVGSFWGFLAVGSFWWFLGFLAQNMAKMPQNRLFLAIVAIETVYITLKINHLWN